MVERTLKDKANIALGAVSPSFQTVESADEMPAFSKALFMATGDLRLTEEERKWFLLMEGGQDGDRKQGYLLIAKNIPSQMNQRAKTFASLLRKTHSVRVIYTTREILNIVYEQSKNQRTKEANLHVNETELYNSLNELFSRAVQMNASDIHIEAFESKTDIKFRVNGMLMKILEFAREYSHELVRILYNVLAAEGSKDIQFDENKMQSAIVEKNILGRAYRIRVQTAPRYPHGYSIALRLLPLETRSEGAIEALGYTSVQTQVLNRAGMKPTGALIFAGTTGSGKSTTLSNLITDKIRKTKGVRKVITIENPPEYVINGALQININDSSENAQATFADAIKVAMRMDPDILMIGEVRDSKTAKLLQDSVQSGHQVFTTVHAQSALGIFERLVGLGFDREVLTSPGFLSLLVYQALVPLNCPDCAISLKDYEKRSDLDAHMKETIARVYQALPKDKWSAIKFRNPDGCKTCQKTGFKGRSVIAEFIEPDDTLLSLIRNGDYVGASQQWLAKGGIPLYDNVILKIESGELDPLHAEDRVGFLTAKGEA